MINALAIDEKERGYSQINHYSKWHSMGTNIGPQSDTKATEKKLNL